ncbi:hypothetical protein IA01_09685 [Flavobacterium psychrophilum]|uniref:Uncharacterized protein n=1 Tax=Flavobacterium psychrophilum TaxID=96345 RepID=A0A7U2NH36_FLAPS|nr:hypothetical protein [Flavobacterium psychrophilum]AIG30716.1 hypothetical protein IA03_09650 [Flavobacterium psychrophilum]AIG32991.1 hypothetical protein IA01_09685 [Flavobacterium psychrophilum]AIG35146.1 hypothetical protein IA02_09070 [Flavobacterium psychrophilum]AIG37511.1 hypothetical protein IA04_09590 [Flavobacterium psychrophilum]AIG39775.1 hypothetical protein IA05_09660 [Flavobacterium psychrophilum]
MFSKPLKTIFAITAFAPILLIWWIVSILSVIDKKGETKIIKLSEITLENFQNKWYLGIGFIISVLICYFLIFLIRKKLTRNFIEIKSIKSADLHMNTILFSYLLPCTELYKKDSIYIYAWIILLFIIIYINRNTYFYNPLMKFFGYRYYEIATKKEITYTMISKEKLINADDCNAYSQITDYVIFNSTIK